jgi:hypothetical protein
LIEARSKPRFKLDADKSLPPWYRTDALCEPFTSLSTPEYLCPTCRRIDTEQFLEHYANEHRFLNVKAIYLGSVRDIFLGASTCGFCRLITNALWAKVTQSLGLYNRNCPEDLVIDTIHTQLQDEYYLYPLIFKSHYWNPLLRLSRNPKEFERLDQRFSSFGDGEDDVAIRPFKVKVPGHGRITTSEFIDYAWIKERLTLCDARTTKITHQHTISIRVIDVKNMCIKTLEPDGRYVALSYVWGAVKLIRLLKDSETRLRRVNSLIDVLEQLPKTIQDAIEVVRRIEEPYLWVDALCIRQDE